MNEWIAAVSKTLKSLNDASPAVRLNSKTITAPEGGGVEPEVGEAPTGSPAEVSGAPAGSPTEGSDQGELSNKQTPGSMASGPSKIADAQGSDAAVST